MFKIDDAGNMVISGTVFNEINNESYQIKDGYAKAIFPCTQDRYAYWGLPHKMINLSYSDILRAYERFYEPSNMLITVTGDVNPESFARLIGEKFLNNYSGAATRENLCCEHQSYESINKYNLIKYYKEYSHEKKIYSASVSFIIDSKLIKDYLEALKIVVSLVNNDEYFPVKYLKNQGYLTISCGIINSWADPVIKFDFETLDFDYVSEVYLNEAMDMLLRKLPLLQTDIEKVIGTEKFDNGLLKNVGFYDNFISQMDFMMAFVRFNNPLHLQYNMDENKRIIKDSPDLAKINYVIKKILSKDKQVITVFVPENNYSIGFEYKTSENSEILKNEEGRLKLTPKKINDWAKPDSNDKELKKLRSLFSPKNKISYSNFNCSIVKKKICKKICYESLQNIGGYVAYKLVFKLPNITREDVLCWYLFKCVVDNMELEKIKISVSFKADMKERLLDLFIILDIQTIFENIESSITFLTDKLFCLKLEQDIIEMIRNYVKKEVTIFEATPKSLLEIDEIKSKELDITENFLRSRLNIYKKIDFFKNMILTNEITGVSKKLQGFVKKVFNFNTFYGMGVCGEEKSILNFEVLCEKLIFNLKSKFKKSNAKTKNSIVCRNLESGYKSTAFIVPNYPNTQVIKILNLEEYKHDIIISLMCQLITTKFLLPKIRENNGAYSSSMIHDPSKGKILLFSVNDPDPKATLKYFEQIPDFIENNDFDQETLYEVGKGLINLTGLNKINLPLKQIESLLCEKFDYCKWLNSCVDRLKNAKNSDIKKRNIVLKKSIDNSNVYLISKSVHPEISEIFN